MKHRASCQALAWLGLTLLLLIPASPVDAAVIKQLTDAKSGWFGEPSLSDSGGAIFVNSNTNRFATNPDWWWQLFEFEPTAGNGAALTGLIGGVEDGPYHVSTSDDGEWVAFVSTADPLGQNHDRSAELFLVKTDFSTFRQLTNDPAQNAGAVAHIAMDGAAARVAFVSTSDPLGGNPAHRQQLFVVGSDGSGLAQLTSGAGKEMAYLSISDDGERIVFIHDGDLTGGNADGNKEVFAVDFDGSNLRQLTSSTGPVGCLEVKISGDGGTIVFHSQENLTGGGFLLGEIFAVDWDGSNLRRVTTTAPLFADWPSVTDDGQWIYFHSPFSGPGNGDGNLEIWKIRSDGTDLALVTDTSGGIGGVRPVVSGDGSRVVFASTRSNGGLNDDQAFELFVADGAGSGVIQLTETFQGEVLDPDITSDGTRVVFSSPSDLTGDNPGLHPQLFRIEADGSELTQLTSLTIGDFNSDGIDSTSITDDGQVIVFSGLTAGGGSRQVQRINADGTGLVELSPSTTPPSRGSVIAADGSVVLFDAFGTAGQIYRVAPDGSSAPVQLTFGSGGTESRNAQVDAAGGWFVFESNADLDGSNGDGSFEIFRMRTDGSSLKWVTRDPLYDSTSADISASGARIVYASSADPQGSNPEHNSEIFSFEPATLTTTQLTVTAEGESKNPRISGDGSWVYFVSSASLVEQERTGRFDAYRVSTATGSLERVGGLRLGGDAMSFAFLYWWTSQSPIVPDGDGDRAAIVARGELNGDNKDRMTELWLVDLPAPATIRLSGAAPTLLSWDAEAAPRRYDAIRGRAAELTDGGPGSIDLGNVICLENDSPDATTFGFADTLDPLPGEAFFYLYRGSAGLNVGPGSYGEGSSGSVRLPASGDCSP